MSACRPPVRSSSDFNGYVDEFIDFPGFPGLPEVEPDLRAIPRFIADLQKRRFDLAINLHGFGPVTTMIVSLFGATRVAGYHRKGEWRPESGPLRDGR